MKLTCTLTGASPDYGTVYVDENMNLIHAPAEADANDTLHLENCILSVETPNNEYHLDGNVLSVVRHRLNGSVTAEAWVYTAAPEKLVEFEYNSAGLRVQKKVTDHGQTVTTNYIYGGKRLAYMMHEKDVIHFFYGQGNQPIGFEFGGRIYRYVNNVQGDVAAIVDCEGNQVVNYQYTASGIQFWQTENLLAQINPYRYRSYFYDEDIKLYCLKSRCYNPSMQRFLNADGRFYSPGGLLYNNLYTYCTGNCVCKADQNGTFSVVALGVAIGKEAFISFGMALAVLFGLTGQVNHANTADTRAYSTSTIFQASSKSVSDDSRVLSGEITNLNYRNSLENAEFYLAYSGYNGEILYNEYAPMNLAETLVAIGALETGWTIDEICYYNASFSIDPQNIPDQTMKDTDSAEDWGVYTKDHAASEGLAFLLGYTKPPEISKGLIRAYYHYHDANHNIHIWYGIRY